MSTMEAEVFEAFRSVGVADDKAILAAQALGKRDPDIGGLKQDVASLKTDMVLLKWMVGVVMAMSLTILFKIFHT
jgi:hypothetical protein